MGGDIDTDMDMNTDKNTNMDSDIYMGMDILNGQYTGIRSVQRFYILKYK